MRTTLTSCSPGSFFEPGPCGTNFHLLRPGARKHCLRFSSLLLSEWKSSEPTSQKEEGRMGSNKDQRKAGIRANRRGQQMGTAGKPDQNRKEMDKTPALRGRLRKKNVMFADESTQHTGGDAV